MAKFKGNLCFLLVCTIFGPMNLLAQEYSSDKPFYDPIALFLTWQEDPTSTITIDWHTINEDRTQLEIRKKGTDDWSEPFNAKFIDFPWSDRTINRVHVTDLESNTYYDFRFGESSKVYHFRTMPTQLIDPIRIVVGGCMMHQRDWMEQTSKQALRQDPDLIIIGGDLAYAGGLAPEDQRQRDTQNPRVYNQWYSWFDAYKKTLITDEGRVIPMVVSVGNTEVRGAFYDWNDHQHRETPYSDDEQWRAEAAPYFFALFAMPGQPGYNVLDFGKYLSIILLDTDHLNPVQSQNNWLERVLKERIDVPHLIPVYHVPAWPSVRNYEDERNKKVRENWVPLFEKYGVQIAFEANDHAYK